MKIKIGVILCFIYNSPNASYVDYDRVKTNAYSPCQCLMIGGCLMEIKIKNNQFYADGTKPSDYKNGRYTGSLNAPIKCRQ